MVTLNPLRKLLKQPNLISVCEIWSGHFWVQIFQSNSSDIRDLNVRAMCVLKSDGLCMLFILHQTVYIPAYVSALKDASRVFLDVVIFPYD